MLKNDYFKGWYFKCSAQNKTIAFIPAYHRNNRKETASLQIISDDAVYNLPFNSLKYSEKPLRIKVGDCFFTEKGIKLNIQNDNLTISGELHFHKLTPIRYDIMGPFHFVPFMQCRHSVYSMRHMIDGQITINGEQLNFKNGIGYIEGDRGRSFPCRYVWTQCCYENTSIMLSVADIPFLGFGFDGIIGIVMLDGKEYRIATYIGAKLRYIGENTVSVNQGNYTLTAKLIKPNSRPLYAPTNGNMNRTIHESASCKAYYKFSYKDKTICEFTSNGASFEFEYF